jgi:hypothetical protein
MQIVVARRAEVMNAEKASFIMKYPWFQSAALKTENTTSALKYEIAVMGLLTHLYG